MTIRKKMILIVLASTIIPMCFVGMLGYFHARKTLESLRMEQLKSIADLKIKRIEDFFGEHRKHIMIAQQRPTLKKYTAILAEFAGDFSSPAYEIIRDELDRALATYQPVYDYKNVLLTNPEGKIVYLLRRASASPPLGHSLPDFLGRSFNEGQNEIQYAIIFSDKNETSKFSMFLTAPIRNFEERFVGTAAFEIDMESIYELILDTTGLGETGETFIAKKAGNQTVFLNPLRHDPVAALKKKVVFGEKQAIPVQEALKGNNGSGISVDYRGQEVLAAWRYIPSLDWGVVAKIDLAEAFEPVTTLRDFVLVLVIAVIVLSILAAFIVAKSLSDPIQALQQGVEEIGTGNLDHKVATNAKDEIGQLGRAFDQMTAKLKAITASRDELDREVNERKKAEKTLDERVKELNCLFEISRLVEKQTLTIDGILQGIIDLIPPAWQYPDITCAKINLKEQEFKTSNFKETIWQQTSDIIVHGVQSGNLVVGLFEDRPERDEGPFLQEERGLLDAIVERVGRIIERRWAQEAVLKSEEKFRELMENMHSGVAVYEAVAGGEDFEVKDFNRSGEKIDNIERAKVIGRRVRDVFPGVKNSGLFDVLQRVWKTGRPEHFSGGVYQNHRTPPSWRESYVYKLSSGEIVTVYQDVTQVKLAQKALEESEKRFRDLVENALTGISIVQNHQVAYQNKEQERLLGPLPRSYLLADYEKIHPDDVKKVKRLSQRIDKAEIKTLEMEFRFYPQGLSKNARAMRWVYCRAMLTEYRGKESVLVSMIDMTQAKELEKLLAIQDKMASLGRVAAGIAHEIRNPLSGINIYLNTLSKLHHKEGSEEKVQQILGQIQSASHKIESVIRRVMDFAKPGEPRLALIDLNRPIMEAIKLSAVTLRKSGVELESVLAEDLLPCKADAALIEAMALNILNNSAEAMKQMEAGKKIVVTSSVEGESVILTISDSGPGIAPDVKDKIFDPYFTTKSDGTGIGLSLSHRIVTDHGGSLTVADSDLGGAEFRIEIPIK
ncbi:MAG: ATP-binding protein [Desulfobacterales bacterium]